MNWHECHVLPSCNVTGVRGEVPVGGDDYGSGDRRWRV